MAPGFFANLFLIEFKSEKLNLVEDDRKKQSSLKELREKTSAHVYTEGDKVYGYGPDLSELRKIGFKDVIKDVSEIPRTTSKIILDGFSGALEFSGFKIESSGFMMWAYNTDNPIITSIPEIRLLKGYEYRVVYMRHPLENKLVFGVILDLKFRLLCEDQPSSYSNVRRFVAENYDKIRASEIIKEVRVKTGDLTPRGGINAEASRFRYENILDIIKRVGRELKLPTGDIVILSQEPTSIILEVGT